MACGYSQNKYDTAPVHTIVKGRVGGATRSGEQDVLYERVHNSRRTCARRLVPHRVAVTPVPPIDLCGFDFVCYRGGFRVPDLQVIATTISIIIIITISTSTSIGTGRTETAAGVTAAAAAAVAAAARPAGPR